LTFSSAKENVGYSIGGEC